MKNIYDQLAKGILKAALADVARLETNREIPGHVLEADLWVEPEPGDQAGLAALGMLGRMVAMGPCLLEPFSGVPRASELQSCILKQHSLAHAQRRAAKAAGDAPAPFPRLWVIANGSPDGPIAELRLLPMPDWPDGCMTGRPFDPLHLVVLRKLPRTPDTVLLRLLGRGEIFREAARELATLPGDTHFVADLVKAVRHVLIEFDRDLTEDQLDEEDMASLREMAAAYDEWELRTRDEGRQEGRQEGLQAGLQAGLQQGRRAAFIEAVEVLCDVLDIELTDAQRHDMAGWDMKRLESTMATLRTTRRWPGSLS